MSCEIPRGRRPVAMFIVCWVVAFGPSVSADASADEGGAGAVDGARSALADVPVAASAEPAPLAWRRVAVGVGGRRSAALAFEPERGRLAIGDDSGVRVGAPGGILRRVTNRGPVSDLLFLPGGALLVATGRGLVLVEGEQASASIAPGPGERARAVHRVAAAGGLIAAATGNGVYASLNGRRWYRLAGNLPAGAATAVALRVVDSGIECWALFGGQLWRSELELSDDTITAGRATREVIAAAGLDRGAVDVVSDLPGAPIAVVFPKTLALRRSDVPDVGWEVVRPALPAGAELRRLGRGAGRFWLATDRGLLVAGSLRGPWGRAASPVGTSGIQVAVGSERAIYVSADSGILGARTGTAAAESAPSPGIVPSADPSVAEVHRAAIGYLGLTRSRLEAMRSGVRRRGWWPIVAVRAAADWDRGRSVDRDQSFLSGEIRHLVDRDRDRDDSYAASLTFSWDLGDIAYEPESIDVSRETREVIELRDDVLDEITQLYFERRRILATLRASAPTAPTATLRLRADELAAGIDAWTGGWFSAQVTRFAP